MDCSPRHPIVSIENNKEMNGMVRDIQRMVFDVKLEITNHKIECRVNTQERRYSFYSPGTMNGCITVKHHVASWSVFTPSEVRCLINNPFRHHHHRHAPSRPRRHRMVCRVHRAVLHSLTVRSRNIFHCSIVPALVAVTPHCLLL